MPDALETRAGRFFLATTSRPRSVLAFCGLLLAAFVAVIPRLTMDTRTEAFIPQDHPSVVYREMAREIFGLEDPMVVAVVNDGPRGVFEPETLALVKWLSEHMAELPGIDPDRITSLATENDIVGSEYGMSVVPFFDELPESQAEADSVRAAVMDFPLYLGSLVARDGSATLVIAELLDQDQAQSVYDLLLTLVEEAPRGAAELHVAGQGAVRGYLGTYIQGDAMRLNPLAGLVVSVLLFVAYRTVRGVLLPNLVVAGAVAAAIGSMAALGVPFYVITNSLPVILVAIGVADGIHILAQYYEELATRPSATAQQLTVRAMVEMWRPVCVTSLTDIAGFMALGLSSYMPPMRAYGLFASIGVAMALLLSLLALPAILVLLRPKASPAIRSRTDGVPSDAFGAAMGAVGRFVVARPGGVLVVSALIALAGVLGALRLEVNEATIENFRHSEPLYRADVAINARMDGTNTLDVVVEVPDPEGLFRPDHLRRIEALQRHMETLPHVRGTTSIVDYLKQMNRALNEGRPDAYALPEGTDLVAQYFLLYEASGDPSDFEEEIDTNYRLANVRARLDTGMFREIRPVVESLENYVQEEFNSEGIVGTLAGRVNVDYHWIRGIGGSYATGVAAALLAVWAMAAVCFRSAMAGLFSLLPVALAVLLVHAVMGVMGIWLGVGTSMFAAIAIGIGVDFAVHTVDRLIVLMRGQRLSLEQAVERLFPSTGRALLFNFSAVLLGFGVLLTSHVPPLNRLGGLIGIAVFASFVASVTLLPALIAVSRPAFLGYPSRRLGRGKALGTVLLLVALLIVPVGGQAEEVVAPSGLEIARNINARDEGEAMTRIIEMELIDRRGKVRRRLTRSFRKYYGADKKTAIFYLEPKNIKDTAFLTYDYAAPDRDDDQWLYLPALRKVRRISASDRGDYFLGTDLTYDDIKRETKVTIPDFSWQRVGHEEVDGHGCWLVEATPVSEAVARELGYSKVRSWVDDEIWMARQAEYWDVRGNALKTVRILDIRRVQGIWTAHRIEVDNHKSRHRTVFGFSETDYEAGVDDDLFSERMLRRGLR